MAMNELLAVLLGAGGAGGLAGLINVLISYRDKSVNREETLIQRLNQDSKQQGERADRAEVEAEKMRRQRDRARELAARYRAMLIANGVDQLPAADDLYGD
jgi:hypothetical protein